MTQKKISRIRRYTDYGSEYPVGKYQFVFSDDLNVWMGAKTTRTRNQKVRESKTGHRKDFHLKHG